ncbi:hypothetical protein ACR03S_05020 [Limimaricola variabilis]|jgi:hypothetical protein|uniref:hypothetical protein n=1 Tax=Limimaricola variabilis TaxID=1492771 RepID=UPI002AC93D1C|nr:hypothetical protein [Limimaricola variabilis]WPY94650.1 hypothetical protein T8T21_00560 [Limimaricola variabilis]
MMKILGIIAAAVLAVVVVTSIWGGDDAEVTTNEATDEEVGQLAETPTADIVDEEAEAPAADIEPNDEMGEITPPEGGAADTEALTEEVEEETVDAPEGAEPVILMDDENLAEEVEAQAEEALGTEAAGNNEGLAILEAALEPETFDYEAVQQAIADSALESDRRDQLATALERARRYPAIRDALLEDIRAELGVE